MLGFDDVVGFEMDVAFIEAVVVVVAFFEASA